MKVIKYTCTCTLSHTPCVLTVSHVLGSPNYYCPSVHLPVGVASREPRSAVQQSTVTSGRSVDKSTMAASVVAGHDAGGRQPRVQSAVEEKREKAKKGPQQNVQSKGGGTSGDSKARQPAQPKKQDKNTAPVVAANQKNHVGPGPQGSNSSGKGHQIAVEAQQLPVVTGKLGNNQPSNNKGKSVQSLNNANHVQSREVDSSLMKSSGSVKTRAGDLTQKQLEELSVQTVALTSTSESSLQMRNHSKSPCNVSTSVVGKLDSSQSDSSNSDWGSEEMEAEEMRIIAMSRTDDDKLSKHHQFVHITLWDYSYMYRECRLHVRVLVHVYCQCAE